jgi:flagellar L-ring protein precursor FlgH
MNMRPRHLRNRRFLAGCQSQAVKEIGRAPAMSPIGSGLQYAQTPQMAQYPKQPHPVAQGFSLWNDSRRSFQGCARHQCRRHPDGHDPDQRQGELRQRDRSQPHEQERDEFGTVPPTSSVGNLPRNATATSARYQHRQGKARRSVPSSLSLLVAAVVTGILENGNLMISGSQEVRMNQELRILNVAGIVRPQDVDFRQTDLLRQDRRGAHFVWRPRPPDGNAAAAMGTAGRRPASRRSDRMASANLKQRTDRQHGSSRRRTRQKARRSPLRS